MYYYHYLFTIASIYYIAQKCTMGLYRYLVSPIVHAPSAALDPQGGSAGWHVHTGHWMAVYRVKNSWFLFFIPSGVQHVNTLICPRCDQREVPPPWYHQYPIYLQNTVSLINTWLLCGYALFFCLSCGCNKQLESMECTSGAKSAHMHDSFCQLLLWLASALLISD